MRGVRYDASVDGPVSQWMFCTDLTSLVCGGADAEGGIVEEVDPESYPVDPMNDLGTNPKLDATQEKLISYLVQKGHSYAGVGYYQHGAVSEAVSGAGTFEREALQALVWCISDPVAVADAADLAATCAANMDSTEQARLLTMIPETAILQLQFEGDLPDLDVGATARFRITTNVYNQPIELMSQAAGPVTVSVCSGDATLDADTLTVAGDDPSQTTEIVLCAQSDTPGSVALTASAQPPSTQHILWAQSPTDGPDGAACQVFANFSTSDEVRLSTRAQVRFVAAVIVRGSPSLRTRVSDARVQSGATLTDRVSIRGLASPYEGTATARL